MLSTMVGVGNATGAAMRRRQRRLRAWARHERLSIAMALATVEHHSSGPTANAAPRGQTTSTSAREGEVREQHHGLRAQKRPLPGMRPAPLLEVLPQVGVQRHTVEQRIEHTPYVQILDAPVPLMVEQLVDVLQLLDALVPVAEQVFDVPKMFIERIPPRTSVREPQLAEQLVEAPTIVSFPRCSGLWNRPWTFQFRRVVGESLVPKVFFQDRVQQLCSSAFLSGCLSRCLIAFPVEVLKVFAQDKVHLRLRNVQLESLKTQMSLLMGFFALFTRGEKSATVPPHSRSELPPHSSSWTSAAYALPTVPEMEAGAGGSC